MILAIDVSALAYRSFYSTGGLSVGNAGTGVLYGIFRDIRRLQDQNVECMAFCFDSAVSTGKRRKLYAGYKLRDVDDDRADARKEVVRQVDDLRLKYLPIMGYRNILWQEGYEADDMIAAVVRDRDDDEFVDIISRDHDLYVLLQENVRMMMPGNRGALESYTEQDFHDEWQLPPDQWMYVKAIAGCSSDCVPGICGVGEKTAAKYLRSTLSIKSRAYMNILSDEGESTIKRNLGLVMLPFCGVRKFVKKPDRFNPVGWNRVMRSLSMKTLEV